MGLTNLRLPACLLGGLARSLSFCLDLKRDFCSRSERASELLRAREPTAAVPRKRSLAQKQHHLVARLRARLPACLHSARKQQRPELGVPAYLPPGVLVQSDFVPRTERTQPFAYFARRLLGRSSYLRQQKTQRGVTLVRNSGSKSSVEHVEVQSVELVKVSNRCTLIEFV